MRIVKIEKYNEYPICDTLLEHGYYTDSVFDECFIKVTVNIDGSPTAPIYRKLWEDIYIKIQHSITRLKNDHVLVVGLTVSEAIGFIYKATPPRFQKNISESHKSIDDIIKSLETFLLGDESYISFSSMFFEHAHLNVFDTQWNNFNIIKTGADLVASYLERGKSFGFYVYASTHPIPDLAAGKDCEIGSSTTMICTKLDINSTPNIINFCKTALFPDELGEKDASFRMTVDNIHIENNSVYVGLNMSTNTKKGAGVWNYIPNPYSRIIADSYKNIK